MSTSKPSPTKKRRTDVAAGTKKSKILAAKGKGKDPSTGAIEIQPGESLKHFNRCVHFPLNLNVK